MGAEGIMKIRHLWAPPGTNTKRSYIVCAVTSIALILGPPRAKMLGRSAQSLIGSPGTLGESFTLSFFFSDESQVQPHKHTPPDPLRKAKILLGDNESGAKISPVVNW